MIHFNNDHITVFQSALYQTTSAVIETDDLVLVTDPNWLPQEVEQIRKHVEAIKKDRQLYLLFTHSDFDHIIGYMAFPEAKIIASRELHENSHQEEILEQIREFDDRYYLERNYEIAYPQADVIVERDGQSITIGGTKITFYKAPGHTPDGIFAIIEPLGVWIAGDYLSDVEFPFIYHSSYAYEKTLEKSEQLLKNRNVNLLVPGHGNVTENISEIESRQQESLRYIRKLRDAVSSGNNTELKSFIETIKFPRGAQSEHEQNQRLIKAELEGLNHESPYSN